MPRMIFHKTTGRIGEFQSDATPGTLINNILAQGENPSDWSEVEIGSIQEYYQMLNDDPTRGEEREKSQEAKLIGEKASVLAMERNRGDAIKELKRENPSLNFKHFDDKGREKQRVRGP